MESLWKKQIGDIRDGQKGLDDNLNHNASSNNHRDVIVIGAGMAGLLVAYYLQEKGKNVLVLEAKKIASGQTEKTTAKITSQHDLKYSKLIKTIGRKKAWMYAQANQAAILEYEELIRKKKIDCEFSRVPSYLYTFENEEVLIKEAEAATSLGIDSYFVEKTELPFPVKGAVCFRNQALFSPLTFVQFISAELNILEHTKVLKIKGNKVITEKGIFTGDKIVVATHYPIRNVPGFYFLRQHQERSYVLALSGCGKIRGMYYGIDEEGLSFRQAGEYLLLGGGSHRTGQNKGCSYSKLMEAKEKYYPNSKEVARWSAQDCMPHDGLPFIGKYSIFTPNLYVVTGFQKWGMTSSMIAAMILRDELTGVKNPYSKLFSPQRMNVKAGIGNLLIDVGESIKGLSKGWLKSHKNGKNPPRCPHMGCELTWNVDEKTWDCPCHGSRFNIDGKLLDNPAKMNIFKDFS